MDVASRNRGCLLVFLAPFFLIAIGAAVAGIQALLANDFGEAVPRLMFAAIFGGVATIILVASRIAARANSAASPEPWLARADWAARRIEDSTRREAILLLLVALFWNTVTSIVGYGIVTGGGLKAGALLFLLFPAIGLALLALAVVALLRWRRYGTSTFELATLPAVPGNVLAGRVHLTTAIDPPQGFTLTLRCVQITVTGSGKNRSTRETVLWEQIGTMPGALQEGGGSALPIAVALPGDARETDERDSSNRVVWRLLVSAEVPGVDFKSTFEVPVFRVPAVGHVASEGGRLVD